MDEKNKKIQANQFFTNMLIQGGISGILSPLNAIYNIENFKGNIKQELQQISNAFEDSKENMKTIGTDAINFMGMQTSSLLSRGVGGGDISTLVKGTNNTAKLELQEINDNWQIYSNDIIKQIKQQAKMVKIDSIAGFIQNSFQVSIGAIGNYYMEKN